MKLLTIDEAHDFTRLARDGTLYINFHLGGRFHI